MENQLFEIKHRFSGAVLFSLDCGSFGLCVEAAVKSEANLSFADLSFADLSFADLSYANLRYANLRFADLSFADLCSANLRYADLRYANLSSANLRYANLRFADLSSADLSSASVLQIGPLGSRRDYLIVQSDAELGVRFTTGCFSGTEDQFKEAIQKTHGDNEYAKQYRAAIEFALLCVKPAEVKTEAA